MKKVHAFHSFLTFCANLIPVFFCCEEISRDCFRGRMK